MAIYAGKCMVANSVSPIQFSVRESEAICLRLSPRENPIPFFLNVLTNCECKSSVFKFYISGGEQTGGWEPWKIGGRRGRNWKNDN